MTSTLPATTGKSVATSLIGLMTLLWGGVHAALGASFLLVWTDLLPLDTDLSDRITIQRGVAYLALFGVLFLVLGILAVAGALGLFSRKPWGRILTLIVAVLAISSGLCLDAVVPPTSGVRDATDISFAVAQVVYGILAFAILSMNRVDPIGIYILRLLSILVGLPVVFFWGLWLPEFIPGGARRDSADFFATLSVLSGFIAGLLIVASGTCLLTSGWKQRFVTVVALMVAAGSAQVALAVFALLGAMLGHTREGLLEGYLLVFVVPVAIVLLVLTASGVWYLKRPHVRRALEVE
jgi:hypothetical protein